MRSITTRISAILLIAVLAVLGAVLTGCPRPAPGPDEQTTTTTGAPATTTTTEEEIVLKLYFVDSFQETPFLVPENRAVPRTRAVARTAVQELIKGSNRPGRSSFIPGDTKVLSVKIDDGLATVDFSKEVLNANVGSTAEELGIYQIVNTLTEFENIKRVKFLVEGKERGQIDGREIQDWWGHIGLADQPFSRREDLIRGGKVTSNTIIVDEPRAFTTVDRPLTIKGRANVFEAQFQVRILDVNDNVLADVPVMSEGFDFGPFGEQIQYKNPEQPGRGTVFFYYFSPKDGSQVTMAKVTVFLK